MFDDKDKAWRIRFGIATFVRKKCAVMASRSGFVHDTFWPGELRDPPVPARAHALELWRPETERSLVVAHMHGLWDPAGKEDTPARDEQFAKFEVLVNSMTNPGNPPAVVCGDFNILPDSKYLASFKRIGFRELVEGGDYNSTRTSFYKRKKDSRLPYFADYMLVSSRVKVKKFDVVYDPEVSDHCPLVLDIE